MPTAKERAQRGAVAAARLVRRSGGVLARRAAGPLAGARAALAGALGGRREALGGPSVGATPEALTELEAAVEAFLAAHERSLGPIEPTPCIAPSLDPRSRPVVLARNRLLAVAARVPDEAARGAARALAAAPSPEQAAPAARAAIDAARVRRLS